MAFGASILEFIQAPASFSLASLDKAEDREGCFMSELFEPGDSIHRPQAVNFARSVPALAAGCNRDDEPTSSPRCPRAFGTPSGCGWMCSFLGMCRSQFACCCREGHFMLEPKGADLRSRSCQASETRKCYGNYVGASYVIPLGF